MNAAAMLNNQNLNPLLQNYTQNQTFSGQHPYNPMYDNRFQQDSFNKPPFPRENDTLNMNNQNFHTNSNLAQNTNKINNSFIQLNNQNTNPNNINNDTKTDYNNHNDNTQNQQNFSNINQQQKTNSKNNLCTIHNTPNG